MSANPKQERDDILAKIPPDAQRVQMVDEFGHTRWRAIDAILPTDTFVLSSTGEPTTMSRKLGRPQKVELKPVNEKVGEMVKQKKNFIEDDDLFTVVTDNPERAEVLDYVIKGLAEETASLGFERQEAERNGQPTSQISLRRVNALKAVGDTWLKRREQLTSNSIDLESIAFKRLFKYINTTFEGAMEDAGVRPELIESVFASFTKRVSDDAWDHEATKRMLGEDD